MVKSFQFNITEDIAEDLTKIILKGFTVDSEERSQKGSDKRPEEARGNFKEDTYKIKVNLDLIDLGIDRLAEGFSRSENQSLKTNIYLDIADFYSSLNKYTEAAATYKKLTHIIPHSDRAYIALGHNYICLSRYNEAVSAYKEALKIRPDNIKLYTNIGLAYYRLSQYEEAVGSCNKVIETEMKNEEMHIILGASYTHLKLYNEAVSAYDKAIEIKPDNHLAYSGLGSVYYKLEEYPKALVALEEAIKLDPLNDKAYANLSIIYVKMNKLDKAIEACKKTTEINPHNTTALTTLEYVYKSLNKLQQGLTAGQPPVTHQDKEGISHKENSPAYHENKKEEEVYSETNRTQKDSEERIVHSTDVDTHETGDETTDNLATTEENSIDGVQEEIISRKVSAFKIERNYSSGTEYSPKGETSAEKIQSRSSQKTATKFRIEGNYSSGNEYHEKHKTPVEEVIEHSNPEEAKEFKPVEDTEGYKNETSYLSETSQTEGYKVSQQNNETLEIIEETSISEGETTSITIQEEEIEPPKVESSYLSESSHTEGYKVSQQNNETIEIIEETSISEDEAASITIQEEEVEPPKDESSYFSESHHTEGYKLSEQSSETFETIEETSTSDDESPSKATKEKEYRSPVNKTRGEDIFKGVSSENSRQSEAATESLEIYRTIKLCKEAINENPKDYLAYTDLGFAYFEGKHYAKAIRAFEQAIKIQPNIDSVLNLKEVLILTNNLTRSLDVKFSERLSRRNEDRFIFVMLDYIAKEAMDTDSSKELDQINDLISRKNKLMLWDSTDIETWISKLPSKEKRDSILKLMRVSKGNPEKSSNFLNEKVYVI